jgi:hypothetical protein
MRKAVMVLAAVAAMLCSTANANSVTVQIGATIRPVQCTAEQRTRIRACAEGSQTIAAMPYKTVTAVRSTGTADVSYEVGIDLGRHVLVETILY